MNKKMLTILIGATLGTVAFAQVPGLPAQPVAPVEAPVFSGQGNSLEREVTPLIREISRKKAILELRKLDREIEKLEEEALKAQAERESIANGVPSGTAPGMGPMGGVTPGVYNPNIVNPSAPPSLPSVMAESSVRVLMVYGFEDNLYAKIASGQQGGYVVKKGDTMPDGRVVLMVNPNYIEVGEVATKGKKNSQKIFVSSSVAESASGSGPSGMPQPNNNQGSASLMASPIGGAPINLSLPGLPR